MEEEVQTKKKRDAHSQFHAVGQHIIQYKLIIIRQFMKSYNI